MNIETVKEVIDIETKELIGYLVNGNLTIPLDESNRHFTYVQEWLKENKAESAFSEEEILQNYESSINSMCGEIILSKYPDYKQRNIDRLASPYTEEDRNYMYSFIDDNREIADVAIRDKTKLDDIEWRT